MSSSYVRTQFKSFLTANSGETFIDLTGKYLTMQEIIEEEGLDYNDPWLGLQFTASDEIVQTVPGTNASGKYRELGSIFLHIVERATSSSTDDILTRAETLRDLLRGRRINDIVIEGVTPANFEVGTTLDLEAGYISASIIVNYERDLNL